MKTARAKVDESHSRFDNKSWVLNGSPCQYKLPYGPKLLRSCHPILVDCTAWNKEFAISEGSDEYQANLNQWSSHSH